MEITLAKVWQRQKKCPRASTTRNPPWGKVAVKIGKVDWDVQSQSRSQSNGLWASSPVSLPFDAGISKPCQGSGAMVVISCDLSSLSIRDIQGRTWALGEEGGPRWRGEGGDLLP